MRNLFFLILLLFLFTPFSSFAFDDIFSPYTTSEFVNNLMPETSYTINEGNPVWVLGFFNILDLENPNYDILIGCDGNYQDIYFGNVFLPLNLKCENFTIWNNASETILANFIVYYQKFPFPFIENLDTMANFYLDRTINYGDILVIIFLTIFMIFIITKAIAGFVFKPH